MASSSSSSSSSDSERSVSTSSHPRKRQRLSEDSESDASSSSGSDSEDSQSDSGSESEAEEEPVLSHAEKRRQKKKENRTTKSTDIPSDDPASKKGKPKVQNTAELPPSKLPKRQNSVWVGNLSFKTTPASLRAFFEGVGEITRIHMPMKMATGGPEGKGPRKENRGSVLHAHTHVRPIQINISVLSPLPALRMWTLPLQMRRPSRLPCPKIPWTGDGCSLRMVCIHRSGLMAYTLTNVPLTLHTGDDFQGRPAPAATAGEDGAEAAAAAKLTGHSKTAQKILRMQKQPPGPTLFLGNLGFETTEDSIRELLESHRSKEPSDGADGGDKWIRKIRLGTFEDSGKCKGCVLSPQLRCTWPRLLSLRARARVHVHARVHLHARARGGRSRFLRTPARRPLPRVKSADTRRNGNARWNPRASCTPHDRRELISSSHGSAAAHSPRVRQRRRDDHERGEGRTEPVRASSPRISCAPGSRLPRAHSDKIQIHTVSITHHALASCTMPSCTTGEGRHGMT